MRILGEDGEELCAEGGFDEAAIVFEHGGGGGVSKVGGGGGCVFGEFVFVGGVGVAHGIVRPLNARGLDDGGLDLADAVKGNTEGDTVGMDGILGEDGFEVVVDWNGSGLVGFGDVFGDADVVGGEVCAGEFDAFFRTHPCEEADGDIRHHARVGREGGLQKGARLV